MQAYRAHLIMLNDKIRKRILDFYYEKWHESTGLWAYIIDKKGNNLLSQTAINEFYEKLYHSL